MNCFIKKNNAILKRDKYKYIINKIFENFFFKIEKEKHVSFTKTLIPCIFKSS